MSPSLSHEAQPQFSPALRIAGRTLAAIGGVLAGLAMFVFGGLGAAFSTCVGLDGYSNVCGDLAVLVELLECIAVLGGAAAAAIGGIATGVTGRAHWVGIGLAISFVLVLLLAVVIGLQEPALH
jgi:hypothetical protein